MRKRGDRSIPITEKDIAIVEKFLTNGETGRHYETAYDSHSP